MQDGVLWAVQVGRGEVDLAGAVPKGFYQHFANPVHPTSPQTNASKIAGVDLRRPADHQVACKPLPHHLITLACSACSGSLAK